jgi:hypothetical protein
MYLEGTHKVLEPFRRPAWCPPEKIDYILLKEISASGFLNERESVPYPVVDLEAAP